MGKIPERVILLYTDYFEGKRDNTEGHPFEGRLYRCVYNEDYGYYKVSFYDDGDPNIDTDLAGVILKKLEDDNGLQKYKFVEVTEKNITDLDIEPEDYIKLEEWKSDLKKGIEGVITEGEEFENMDKMLHPDEMDIYNDRIADKIDEVAKGIQASMEETQPAQQAIALIHKHDAGLAEALGEYLGWVLQVLSEKGHQLQAAPLEDAVSNEDNVNVYSAYRALELYKREPEFRALLFEAIDSLLLELRRK